MTAAVVQPETVTKINSTINRPGGGFVASTWLAREIPTQLTNLLIS